MKRLILILALFCTISSVNSQTVIYLYSGESINDTIFGLQNTGLVDNTTIVLGSGTYSGFVIPEMMGTDIDHQIIITSAENNADSVIINGEVGLSAAEIQDSYVSLKNITINAAASDNAISLILETPFGGMEKALATNGGNVTIDSCVIIAPELQANKFAIEFVGNSTYQETSNSGFYTISNNIIKNGDVGVQYNDNDTYMASDYISNIYIINNKFENQLSRNISFLMDGDNNTSIRNIEVKNNDIELPVGNGNNIGIYLESISTNTEDGNGINEISNNNIYRNDIDSASYQAIVLDHCNGESSSSFLVSNNFINIENTDSIITGILVDFPYYISVIHNTIKLIGPKSKGVDYYFPGTKSNAEFVFENNIVYSDSIVFYSSMYVDNYATAFDNNVYFSQNPASAFFVDGYYYNLDEWKAYSLEDPNSIYVDPLLTDFNNPRFNNQSIDNITPKYLMVDYDINGSMRNTPLCDPGAIEQLFAAQANDTMFCFGDSVLISAPSGMYSYLWNTGETTPSIFVSTIGDYSVSVQDYEFGPFAYDTIYVSSGAEIIITLMESKEPKCFGDNSGYISVDISGGLNPYIYNWQGYIDTNKIENLTSGNYFLTVVDNNSCTTDTFFTLGQPEEITATFASEEFCTPCTGSIQADVIGGYPPYQYLWSSEDGGQIVTDLCEGTYSVTIIDDSLCINTAYYSITKSSLAYISGNISYAGGYIAEGDALVELYQDSINGASEIELADSTTNLTDGFFKFESVNPESFYLRGVIKSANTDYENVYTSYFSDIETTTTWQSATLITMACGDTLENVDFLMYEISTPITGPGVFAGTISYENGGLKSTGEPVPGAEVFTEQDPNDEPIANTETDSLGQWTIENIPVGTGYKLKVDIPGLPLLSTYEDIIVDGAKSGDNLNFNFFVDTLSGGGIFTDTVTSIINVNAELIKINTYPNPATNYLTISTTFENTITIKYSILDIYGKEILSSESKNYTNKFLEKIDVNSLEGGTYIIKLKLDNSYFIKKFVKK